MCTISVIVPVYNTNAELLERCVVSILEQSFEDFEIILADDGSNEATRIVLNSIACWDDRIRVLHCSHEGAAAVRRAGIESSKGAFLVFVDSDDEVLPGYFGAAMREQAKYDCDIVWGGIADYISSVVCKKHQIEGSSKLYESGDKMNLLRYIISGGCPIETKELSQLGSKAMVAKLYKKELFFPGDEYSNNLVFAEDVLINLIITKRADKILICPNLWYRRNINPGSTSYSYHPKGIEEALESARVFSRIAEDLPFMQNAAFSRVLSSFDIGYSTQIQNNSSISLRQKIAVIKEAFKDALLQRACEGINQARFLPSGTWKAIVKAYRLQIPLLYVLLANYKSKHSI